MAIWVISCVKLKSVRPHSVITVATWLPIWKQEFQVKLDLEEPFSDVNTGPISEKYLFLPLKTWQAFVFANTRREDQPRSVR